MTRSVKACTNPEWKQSLKFDITESHNYLNVCVWAKLGDERGNLLIGHITLSLTDVALECLCISSGTHQEYYILVAAEAAKAYASRVALQATSSSGKKYARRDDDHNIYSGDILLRFRHIPSGIHPTVEAENESDGEPHPGMLPLCKENMHCNHNFVSVEMDGLHRKCDICSKKIWVLNSKVQECQNCGLKCHKRCTEYCMKQVPCYKKTTENLQEWLEGEFAIYDHCEETGIGNGHRLLDQHKRACVDSLDKSSFGGVKINKEVEGESEGGRDVELQEPNLTDGEKVVGHHYYSESEFESDGSTEENKTLIRNPNLPKREKPLIEKIVRLQQEIEQVNGLLEELQKDEMYEVSSAEREKIQDQIVQYKDRLLPLKLLMMQLNVELCDCSAESDLQEGDTI